MLALLAVAILIGLERIIAISFNDSQPQSKFWQNNYISGIVVSLLFLIAGLFKLWNGFSVLIPGLHAGNAFTYEGWPLLTNIEFLDRFDQDGAFKKNENFIEVRGGGTRDRNIASLKAPIKQAFSASAQIKPCQNKQKSHWRAGLVVSNGSKEILCFHIDYLNMIAAYLNTNERVFYAPANKDLQKTWSTLTIYVSEEQIPYNQHSPWTHRLYGCLDQQCFYLGSVLLTFPVKFSIQAWSDASKDHDVLIKSVSISEPLAAQL